MTKHEPILKTHWERYRAHFTIDKSTLKKLIQPYSNSEIADFTLLSEGCANSNYKVEFASGQPIVLRIYLNHLRNIKLSHGGFFQGSDLTIRPFNQDEEYLAYAQSCLENENIHESLGGKLTDDVQSFIIENQTLLPDKSSANFTHADFDPANMLVKKVKGRYQVSGILDWEFAFSGSYLLDIGMFLRYSHKLPPAYEKKFIEGITSEGNPLPSQWRKSAKLTDIICLLSLLYWNPKKDRPNLSNDVAGLISNTLERWA